MLGAEPKPKLTHPWQWLDWLYMQTSKGRMFSQGWGDSGLIKRVVELSREHKSPAPIEPVISQISNVFGQTGISCYELEFLSPVIELADEVKMARGCLITPQQQSGIYELPICISMPGTGDEGYQRRVKTLALPLAKQVAKSLV